MSLINRMLQDLEARQAAGVDGMVPNHVRALPSERSRWPWWGIAAGVTLAALLAATGAPLVLRSLEDTLAPPIQKPHASGALALAPAVVADPAPFSNQSVAATPDAPTGAATSPAPVAPSPAAAEPPPPLQAISPLDSYGLRVATELSNPPPPVRIEPRLATRSTAPVSPPPPRLESPRAKEAVIPPPAVAVVEPPVAIAKAAPAVVVEPPARKPARSGEGPPRIEKSAREFTPQERAANDFRLAVSLLNDGRPGAASESLRSALRWDPALTDARLLLSNQLVERRQFSEARSVLQDGLARDGAQPRLAMPLARIQVELGESGAAADTLARAAPAATDSAEYRGFHAAVLQRLGRHKEAAAEFQAALRMQPDAGLWWMGLGISLEADGQRGPARDALRRARESGRLTPDLDRFVEQKLQAIR